MLNPIRHGRLTLWRAREGEYWFMRRSHKFMPLTLYAGLPGSGKTLFAVRDAVQLLRAGERVYSNLYIRDRLTGRESLPCMTWLQMMELSVQALEDGQGAYFVWDELHLHCDARAWALTPTWLLHIFAQRRHYKIGLIGTTQHIDQVEKRLRTLVDMIVNIRPTLLRKFVRTLFLRELPLFWTEHLDGGLVDVAPQEAVLGRSLAWAPWYAWSSYSTHEVVAGEDLTAYKDEEVQAMIAALTARAIQVCDPPHIGAFGDSPAPSLPWSAPEGARDADEGGSPALPGA